MNQQTKRLIAELRKNGRENITILAKKYDYPKSTLYDLLHRLEENKIIMHTSKVNFEKLGFPLQVFIIAKTTPQNKENLKNYLLSRKNINNIHRINQTTSYHIEAIFKNHHELEEFLEALETNNTLTELNVYNVIENIASEKFLTSEEEFE